MSKDLFDLSGKVALVTGGSRGLGRQMALAFAERGADIAVVSRKLDQCQAVAAEIEALGRRALPYSCHVGRWDELATMVDAVYGHFGKVDILVNNAAVTVSNGFFDIGESEWDHVQSVNLRGAFLAMQVFGAHMRELGWGRIINHASIAGQQGGAVAGAHYAAAKAGMIVLTKILAAQVAGAGVTVNAIAPAAIEGPAMATMSPDRLAAVKSNIPVGRFGTAAEVAGAVVYLCSDDAGYVTGTTLDINGGLHMR